ncbi:MAG: 30S ribosomal protein S12 methylthiotransferase RimO, partial [Bacilli bacterium]|nr:30S ribosomal protein S12 methylthiotransferase RimO [Bacilli bacterium]
MKKAGIISLGCPKNRVDSENILGLIKHVGYELTNNVDEAEYLFINTCGFINDSKKESIDTILENINSDKKVIVTGCLVERYLDDLKREIPEVDLWIPIKDYPIFSKRLAELDKDIKVDGGLDYHYRILSSGRYTAYLRIGEGCSNHCSYCA